MSPSLPLLLLLSLAQAQAPLRTPTFTVHTAAGTPLKGPLKQLDANWALSLATTPAQSVPGADLIALRRADLPLPPPPAGPQAIFAGGDRLPGVCGGLTADRLAFIPSFGNGAEMSLPLSALSVLWVDDPAGMDRPDLARRRLPAERRSRDVVWLRNGDMLQGNLVRLDRDALVIEVERKEVKIDRNQLAVIALNNELVRPLSSKVAYGQLVLANGCRLSVASVQCAGQTLTAKTLFGASVQVPLGEVAALDIRQGRAVYLSDLKPTVYQYTPYLPGLTFPWVGDGSVAGDDLRLGGQTYVKGLGMHSQSRITYSLNGEYKRFEAVVGLDDRTGERGRVRIKVLVDGKPYDWGWDKELTGRDGPKEVRVNVAGARELTLAVEYGRFEQGQVNWADARLVK